MATTDSLPPVERLQAVEIRPGDIIVATVPTDTEPAEAEAVRAALSKWFAPNRVLVLSAVTIEVHRAEDRA